MNSTVVIETSWRVGAVTFPASRSCVVVVVDGLAVVVVVVVVVVVGMVVVVVVMVGMVVVVVVVVAGMIVVVVVGTDVVVVVAGMVVVVVVVGGGEVVVVATAVVDGARVVLADRVEGVPGTTVEEGVKGVKGVTGAIVVVVGVIEVPGDEDSDRFGVSSDPVRHAPRSNGSTTSEAVHCFPICPERRALREQSYRAAREAPPVASGRWSWPLSG